MQDLELQVSDINKKVSLMLTLLQGHELNKADKGMIGIQEEQESRIEKIEKKFDRITWTFIGMGIPAGYGLVKFVSIILKSIQQ